MHNPNAKKKLLTNSKRDGSVGFREPGSVFGVSPQLDRAIEAKLLSNLKIHPPPAKDMNFLEPTSTLMPTNTGSNDQDLLTIMASRLAKLEDALKLQKIEASNKDKIITELRKNNSDHKLEVAQLKTEQHRLNNQVHEMETFLNDYGLVWVGTRDDEKNNKADGGDKDSDYKVHSSEGNDNDTDGVYKDGADEVHSQQFKLEMEKIKQNITELNILAGEGKAEVVHTQGGTRRLKEPDAVPLTFYSNGFSLFEGPFRPYSVPSSLPFVRDIMDGYFPYELKDRYPNGVPFKIYDRSSEVHSSPMQPFSCGDTKNRSTNIHGMSSINGESNNRGEDKRKKLTKEDFLKKLPASVIKNGRVINIRQSIAASLFKNSPIVGTATGVVSTSTDVISDKKNLSTPPRMAEGIFAAEYKGRPTTPCHAITTLKIKTNSIGTLIVKLNYEDTIATLCKYIDLYTKDSRKYELRSTNKVYNDPHISLQAAGLVPNATLHMMVYN